MTPAQRLPLPLFLLRLSVFLMMVMWTIDKFIRPKHASTIFAHFYSVNGIGATIVYIIAIIQLLILIGFLLGLWKRFTYGIVLLWHALSTLVSYNQYFHPFAQVNLLFYAAWPVLAACFALYYLRDADTLLTVSPNGHASVGTTRS